MNLIEVRDIAHATLCFAQKLELDDRRAPIDQSTVLRCNYLKGHLGGHSWEGAGPAERQARRRRQGARWTK